MVTVNEALLGHAIDLTARAPVLITIDLLTAAAPRRNTLPYDADVGRRGLSIIIDIFNPKTLDVNLHLGLGIANSIPAPGVRNFCDLLYTYTHWSVIGSQREDSPCPIGGRLGKTVWKNASRRSFMIVRESLVLAKRTVPSTNDAKEDSKHEHINFPKCWLMSIRFPGTICRSVRLSCTVEWRDCIVQKLHILEWEERAAPCPYSIPSQPFVHIYNCFMTNILPSPARLLDSKILTGRIVEPNS
ncbi:hypothetical protein J6590_006784 [Homalodisca vitripennis]|nr:hypothetical protein J6590_006784 [Homalodisca vitripennis]